MEKVRRALWGDAVNWLLASENPSVRYRTLVDLCHRGPDELEVREAQARIMTEGPVPAILAEQRDGGFWGEADRFYHAKYTGTVWQLLILAELGADPRNSKIRAACEFVLDNAQDLESGGFSVHRSAKRGGGRHGEVIPCLTGNMTYSLLRLGYFGDPRLERAIEWITTYQRADDGIESPPTGWPYDRAEPCWGRHSCHMGVVKGLKALAAIPEESRTSAVQRKIDDLVDYLLRHHVYKRSHAPERISKPGWLRFGFPLMYQTDILEILGILADLGVRDSRMNGAIDVVYAKRDAEGRWALASMFNDKFIVPIESKGAPSRWITLRALRTLAAVDAETNP